jgi:uncharacterized lipoprotein YmbA
MSRTLGVLALTLLAGCAAPRTRAVVAVLKTRSYHTAECPKVAMARTVRLSLEEARELRLNACPGCRPAEGGKK